MFNQEILTNQNDFLLFLKEIINMITPVQYILTVLLLSCVAKEFFKKFSYKQTHKNIKDLTIGGIVCKILFFLFIMLTATALFLSIFYLISDSNDKVGAVIIYSFLLIIIICEWNVNIFVLLLMPLVNLLCFKPFASKERRMATKLINEKLSELTNYPFMCEEDKKNKEGLLDYYEELLKHKTYDEVYADNDEIFKQLENHGYHPVYKDMSIIENEKLI